MLTNGALKMSTPATCEATHSTISSPASADGRSRFDSHGGQVIDLFGPVPHPANLSARQARELGLLTSGTYGLASTISSRSAALQTSMESRLRQLLTGSVSCEVTWKPWATPWGQSLSKPRARVRSISGTAISLWPTPTAQGFEAKDIQRLMERRRECKERTGNGNGFGLTLGQMVPMCISLWSTIRASDGAKGGPNMTFGAGGCPLPSQVSTVANTSNAPMESGGGSLHPEFAGWEMGYPPEWINCAQSATPSTRARPPRSSKQRAKS